MPKTQIPVEVYNAAMVAARGRLSPPAVWEIVEAVVDTLEKHSTASLLDDLEREASLGPSLID